MPRQVEKRFLQIRTFVQYIPCNRKKARHEIIFIMHLLCTTYNNVFPSTTKAFLLTTMLELSEAKGKKERSLLPVSFAFAEIIKMLYN